MKIVKFDPFADLNKIWESWGRLPAFMETSAMDLYEEDRNLVAEVSLPNFKKDEIKVSTHEGMLEVSAEHKEEEEKKAKRHYYFRESSNQYFRRVALPEGVKADKATASFKDGVLKVTMPMTTPKKAKTITIK